MIPIKPKDVMWSAEQWQAIHQTGQSILVNAGAGSGKTAVLTQRIIEILKKGIKLERLIVLTFTKAAATEMKERIRKELSELVEIRPKLQVELDYLDQAAIQTFDAFSLSIVRKYHYLLGVNKSINIADSSILKLKKEQIIEEVFAWYYEKEDIEFLKFIRMFAIKNDNLLKSYIYNMSEKLDLVYNRDEYLNNYFEKFYNEEYINLRVEEFCDLIRFDIEKIKIRVNNIQENVSDKNLVIYSESLEAALSGLIKANSYAEILAKIDLDLPRIPGRADEDEKVLVKREREAIGKLIKAIKDNLTYQNIDEMVLEIKETIPITKVIIEIIREVDRRLLAYKREVNLYSFLDVAKMAIQVFSENKELRDYYKNNIYEILIDEYQDTSDIQEILINQIANNNVYMVGDLKQSIYRFRNANPDIFKTKYREFNLGSEGITIDLSKNFRSRPEVLEAINKIFSKVMSSKLGGVDYDQAQALEFGNKKYSEVVAEQNYNLEIYTYNLSDDEIKFSLAEKEAFIVAEDIIWRLNSKQQVYDHKLGKLRDCSYADFAILASEKSQFELFKKIFEYNKLPLVIHKEEDFIRSHEIYVIKNILRAIYSLIDADYYQANFKDSILSILRSFLVEASDEEISLVFLQDIREGLKLRFPTLYAKLILCLKNVKKSTLSEILALIYEGFAVYPKIVKLGNVEEIENKLNFLLDKFKELDKIDYTLLDAIKYLELLLSEDLDIEYSKTAKIAENAINMLTIHKSKGLEFPVCYYVGLSSRFRLFELNERILFDIDYGFIVPVYKEGLKETIYKSLLRNKYRVEEISERLRVLYVGLTRAKEKLIVVMEDFTRTIEFKDALIPFVERLDYNSFYSIINCLYLQLRECISPNYVIATKDYEQPRSIKIVPGKAKEIEKRQVSLKMEKQEVRTASTANLGLLSKEQIKNIEFGTLLHSYFELIDFQEDIAQQLSGLDLEAEIKEKIIRFYNLELFKNEIIEYYNEYEFSYSKNNIIYNGIIDLILEIEDRIVIIDFKLSNLEREEYTRQLQIYSDYLVSISNKPVEAYLYSIIREELRKII